MNVPSGYTALDLVGFTDKGPYNSATAYVKNDIVHYGGNLWRCLVDDTTNVTPTEGANWTIYLSEPTSAAEDIIAPVEASAVSTRQYAVGKQLILNDTLYRVTAAVNIGDTLVVDTNIALSDTVVEQLATKANTSSLATVATSGSYVDLSNQPTLGTAAAKDVPTSGNASTTEVVMGDDTRLSDARNAADVYSWAKASTKPTYNGSEINTSAAQTGTAQQSISDTVASGTSMDNVVGTMLNNDKTLDTKVTSLNEALSNEVETRAKLGAHNFFGGYTATSPSYGMTATRNADGSYTFGGTPTQDDGIVFDKMVLPKNTYVLSGMTNAVNVRWRYITLYNGSSIVTSFTLHSADDYEFDLSSYTYDRVRVAIESITANVACSGTMYPMIRLATDADTTYQPYAMTNRELTDVALQLKDGYIIEKSRQVLVVNTNGVKTHAQILNELATSLLAVVQALGDDEFIKINMLSIAGLGGVLMQQDTKFVKNATSIGAYFGGTYTNDSTAQIRQAFLSNTASTYIVAVFSSVTPNFVVYTNSVPASGLNSSITYDVYKKIS